MRYPIGSSFLAPKVNISLRDARPLASRFGATLAPRNWPHVPLTPVAKNVSEGRNE